MVELAFFSVQTVIYQSSTETLGDPHFTDANLKAARAALLRVQEARILSRSAQYDSKYMKASFMNWTIFYYPFTPFFVLFCNVVRTNQPGDYAAMQEFVAYLGEARDMSNSIAKLYKLCSLFLSLITSITNGRSRPTANFHSQQLYAKQADTTATPAFSFTGFSDQDQVA